MITFNYMRWDNFFSYGEDNYLELSTDTVRQLIAGNGAGKTSILLILEEILYGKNHKGIKKADLLNRHAKSKTLKGEVGFTKNKDTYVVKLSRGPSLKVSLICNETDISAHTGAQTMKLIEEVLGISYALFNQLTYLSTDSKLNFLTDTDTERKKFLVRLFNLDKYLEVHDTFKLAVKNIDGEVKETLGSTNTLNSLIDKDSAVATRVKEVEHPVPKKLELNKGSLESDLANIKSINAAREKNNSYKRILNKLDKSLLAEQVEKPDSIVTTNNNKEIGAVKTKITNNKSRISKINKLGDKCPTCFSTIDKEGISNLKLQSENRINQLEEELSNLQDIIDKDDSKLSLYNRRKEVSDEFERLTNIIDEEIEEDLLDKTKIEAELRKLKLKIAERDKEIDRIKLENSKAVESNYAIKAALANIENYKEELVEKQSKLLDLEKSLGTATTLKEIFSTKGLISYKLQFLVLDLEKQINEYLAELSKGRFLLNFSLVGDKLNVVIEDNGKQIEISALSTGELSIVEISTLLAVRKLMSSISGTTVNLLFLDEVISVLSDSNKEVVLDLLAREHSLNILVVSHGFSMPLIPKLGIKKINNISAIEEF